MASVGKTGADRRNQEDRFIALALAANEAGVKLELVGGEHTWEASPMPIHQLAIDRIRASIARSKPQSSDCGCHHMADVYVAFPDGSFKRPDVSIFCRMPEDLSRAVDLVPEAVIEVISVDYESKDLISGPPFYLGQGVKDVVTCNPLTSEVHHFRRDGTKRLSSPSTITLECGCVCTV